MAKIAIDEKGHVKDETITITSNDLPWFPLVSQAS